MDIEENNNLVPGFLGSLIGIRPGETRSFPLQFPESFEQESLQGVRAQFTVSATRLPKDHIYKYIVPISHHISIIFICQI